jgi:hypothetical protein
VQSQSAPVDSGKSTPIVEGPFVDMPLAEMTPAKWVADLSCKVPTPSGSAVDNLISWLGVRASGSPSPAEASIGTPSSSAEKAVAAAGRGRDRAAGEVAPSGPAPSPEPGGASGGSATGSSSLAPSGFLTLAGLLHIGPPRAMRRLRLVSEPWLTTCFVLIPERPD